MVAVAVAACASWRRWESPVFGSVAASAGALVGRRLAVVEV